jgi:hypothetical protein
VLECRGAVENIVLTVVRTDIDCLEGAAALSAKCAMIRMFNEVKVKYDDNIRSE